MHSHFAAQPFDVVPFDGAHSKHPRTRPRASPLHSEFTESPLASSSDDFESSKQQQASRPSTSSGALNSRMKQLMAPPPPPALQPVQWPPMVIQLEEATQEPPPRTNADTHLTRLDRIHTWRRNSASFPDHALAKGVRPRTSEMSSHRSTKTVSSSFRCTACDSSYATRHGLKRHAQGVRTSPACRTAVAYYLE